MELYGKKILDGQDQYFCQHIMSADAFAAMLIHHLVSKNNVTCVRASDGERALIAHALFNEPLAPFLQDDAWLTKYGVKGANMKDMGKAILLAGNRATYLAPTISGLWLPQFKVMDMFEVRGVYVDIFYPYNWARNIQILAGVLNAANKVFLAHHNAADITARFNLNKVFATQFTGFPLTSWSQHGEVLDAIVREQPDLVLVCGGPHGKILVDKVGQLTDKPRVALDVGSAVENAW